MNFLPALPVILPMMIAIGIWFSGPYLKHKVAMFNTLGSFVYLIVSIFLWGQIWQQGSEVLFIGSWPAPFGIAFVLDLFSASMILITGFVGFCVALFIWAESRVRKISLYYAISYQILIVGVSGAFLTGDIFNLFVWFEVMLMASFILICFEKSRPQLEGALKYTVLNLVASVFFLIGVGLLYSATGSLNMAHISNILTEKGYSLGSLAGYGFLVVAFGIKAGVFPLFFWLPASYHTPRIATSALLAGLLTKVGVYCLFRVSTVMFVGTLELFSGIIVAISCLTMLTGVLGAAYNYEIRKILSFHIISQIGYMILGLGIATSASIAASVFYIFHHIIVKTNLFLISGVIDDIKGTTDLKEIGSLRRREPILSFLFLIPALSLAGLPPLSGFFAKFGLIQSGFTQEKNLSVAIALFVGLITLFSMLKIWNEAFWKPQPSIYNRVDHKLNLPSLIPIVLMALITILIGLWPDLLFNPSYRIATELLNPEIYVELVLQGDNR